MRISSAGKGRCAGEKLKKRRQILGRPSQAQFQRYLLRRSSEQGHQVTSSSFVAIDLTRRSVNVKREQFEMGNVASLVPDEHPSCIGVAGQQPPIPVGTAVNLSRPKRPRRNLLPVPPNGRSATPAVKGRRFKLRYYRNLLLPPARPSGSNADALPRVTHCRRGRLNLPTSPALTGSPPILNTIGMGAVADSAATPEGSLRPLR